MFVQSEGGRSRASTPIPEGKDQLKIFEIGEPVTIGIARGIAVPTGKHQGQIREVDGPIFVEVSWTFRLPTDAREAGAWLPVLPARKLTFPAAQKDAIEAEATGAQFGAVAAAVCGVVTVVRTAHAVAFVERDIGEAFLFAKAAGAKVRHTLFNIIQELTWVKPEDAPTAFAVGFGDRVLAGLAKAARSVIFHAPRDISAGGVWTGKLTTRPPAVIFIGFPAI